MFPEKRSPLTNSTKPISSNTAMKINLFFSAALGVFMLLSCNSESQETKTSKPEMISYGPQQVALDKAIPVSDMLKEMKDQTGESEYTFEGEISEVCSKAGCWINVNKGDGSTFMVRFKDHFTIPPKTAVGTKAYLHGVAYWDTVSVEMLQHFAEDAGKSAEEIAKITEPAFELAFEADGITFEKPAKQEEHKK